MATKKSNKSTKSEKTKSTKSKAAAKPVVKAETAAPNTNKACFAGFFARKYEEKESILTIFIKHKFYGALLGEILGTMLLALLLFSVSLMGIASVATYGFAVIAILIAVYAFSGACLNPIIVFGMMVSRRMSVIRGVMYIIAEIIGAWLGWLIFNGFHLAGGESAYDMPAITAIGEGQFWVFAMVELLGAAIIAFFYARAIKYRRSVFTFAAVVAGGISLAVLIGYVASAAFLGLNSNFIMNPAVALMLQIFPTAGESFGEILGGICQALSCFVLIPLIGGAIGFFFSDFVGRISLEDPIK